jgi:hypothetical protein
LGAEPNGQRSTETRFVPFLAFSSFPTHSTGRRGETTASGGSSHQPPDWTAKTIRVARTLYKGSYYLPKSRRSKRSIDVGDQVLLTLRALERQRFGEVNAPADGAVFVSGEGAVIDPDNLRNRVWLPALAKARLRHVRIHSLRHTYTSLLIAQGENIKYISSQLGHAGVQITLDRYGHLFPAEKQQAPARLEAQLAAARPRGAGWDSRDVGRDPIGSAIGA